MTACVILHKNFIYAIISLCNRDWNNFFYDNTPTKQGYRLHYHLFYVNLVCTKVVTMHVWTNLQATKDVKLSAKGKVIGSVYFCP